MGESFDPARLQGILEKRGKFTGVFLTRKYHCTLENGHLTYRRDGEKEKDLDIDQVQYIRPGKDYSFEIVTRLSTHIFVAGSVGERDDWVRALRESMRTTSLRLPRSSTRFLPSRSYSEDSAALYETIPDSPKLATKSPRSQTLNASANSVNASAKNKSQKWLSVAPYETVCDPPDVVPSIAILDLPTTISKVSRGLVSPTAVRGLYESVHEEEKCLGIYEDNLEAVSSKSNMPVSDKPSAECDLYAYASADDVRKVVLKDKPKLCGEYSTVHDSRGSELLYSEVGVWDREEKQAGSESVNAVCGLTTVVESTDDLNPGNDSIGIYALAKDLGEDMAKNQSQQPDEDCCSGIKISDKKITKGFPRSLGHRAKPELSTSTAGIPTSMNVTESNSKTALDCNALESSNCQHTAVCLNAPVSPKDISVLYPYASESFPSPTLRDDSTVLGSYNLHTPQVVKQAPNLYSKVGNELSNESASTSYSASMSFASPACNSATFHDGSVLQCDTPNVYNKVVKAATNDSSLPKAAEESLCPERIPRLPNPRIPSKYQSPFDEMRRVMGETWGDEEVDELQSGVVPQGANAVDELRQFLQNLNK